MGRIGDVHRRSIACLEHGGEVVSCRAMAADVACDNVSSSCMENENEESLSVVDGSVSPDLDDEWRNSWVDDPELECDGAAEEEVKKKRNTNCERGEDSKEMEA